jgi:hypothetical protein
MLLFPYTPMSPRTTRHPTIDKLCFIGTLLCVGKFVELRGRGHFISIVAATLYHGTSADSAAEARSAREMTLKSWFNIHRLPVPFLLKSTLSFYFP